MTNEKGHRKILIVGANSAIAEATARLFAARGDSLYLVSRNAAKLADIAADLKLRGAVLSGSEPLDINRIDLHASLIERAAQYMGGLDIVLIAHGTLPDQTACENSVSLSLSEFQTNALSTIGLLTLLASRFEQAGGGTLAVITSVAGDRGRASNYVYGSAKAAVSSFLSGLRQRLYKAGVQVLDIRPGFVDTPMTKDFKKGLLWASPERIARGIVSAIDRRKHVAYLPFFWFYIMTIIRLLPERLFVRIRL
jgi:short-subunit dehydrogenase